MDVRASYTEGHLLVAAVRVLTHQGSGKPPTVEEVARLLAQSREWTGVLVAALEREGVIRSLRGPFETRLEVKDHTALENLPRDDSAAGVDEELREFSARKREEEEHLKNLFSSGSALDKQKKKMGQLADDLKKYKPRDPKPSSLFKAPPNGED
jgi:hypothetical protein